MDYVYIQHHQPPCHITTTTTNYPGKLPRHHWHHQHLNVSPCHLQHHHDSSKHMKKSPGDEHNSRTQDTFASQASGMFFF